MLGSPGRRILALAAAVALAAFVLFQAGARLDAGAATTTLTPTADAYVDQSAPTTKFGTKQQLIVDGSPVNQSFLTFDLKTVAAPVTSATLRVHVDNVSNGGSPAGGTLASSSNTAWAERSVTWNARPTIDGAPIAMLGAVTQNTWVAVDVTSFIAARTGTKVTFALTSNNADGAYYDTRETQSTSPQLVVNTGSTTTSTSTSAPTSTSTSTSTSAPTSTSTSTTTTTTAPPPPPNGLSPSADTYVEDASPTKNFGTSAQLAVDASPVRELLLRFDLSTVAGPIQQARLRLHVTNIANGGSPDGGSVSRVDDTAWSETGVTWGTRPTAWDSATSGIGPVTTNTWAEVDVTAQVTAGGLNTLGLRSSNADGAYYDSRETGALGPQLVITTGVVTPPVTGVTIAAAGDAACAPGSAATATTCRQMQVSDRLVADPSVTWFLALGDLQYENGELASFQTAYDASFGRLKAKTKPAPGNHEYQTPGATGYYTYFGDLAGDPTKGYYSFDVGTSWHVIALNSNCGAVACAAGSAQEQWLRADLAASARPCTLAFWHHPRWSSNEHGDDLTVAPFWDALSSANAELVLNGHDHGYERFDPQTPAAAPDLNGLREIVAGTGGRSLYPFGVAHANSAVRYSAFGYLRVTLGDGVYSWQFVNESGIVTDSGTGACH